MLQFPPQATPGAQDAGAHRIQLQTGGIGDLLITEMLELAHDEWALEVIGQPIDSFADLSSHLSRQGLVGGAPGHDGVGNVTRGGLARPGNGVLRQIRGDPIQPRPHV